MVPVQVVGIGQCACDLIGALAVYPQVDQKSELQHLNIEGGGPVASALVALRRLDISCAIRGRIGGDDFGDRIRAGLVTEGVDCNGLYVDRNGSSQVAFIVVDDAGRRTIFCHRGNSRPLQADDIDPEQIAAARILHLDGQQSDAALAAARIARDHGVVTVLDGGTLRDQTWPLLPLIDHLVVSEAFARQYAGAGTPEQQLAQLLETGAQAAVITAGPAGCWGQEPGCAVQHQPAFSLPVVDTTGCGDAFHGGYIYGLLQGWGLVERMRFAAAVAALKTRDFGGRRALPALAEVEAFLSTQAQ
jgi:ribokinase